MAPRDAGEFLWLSVTSRLKRCVVQQTRSTARSTPALPEFMPSGQRPKCARIPADRRRFLKLPSFGGVCRGLGASCSSGTEGRRPALAHLARSWVPHRRNIDDAARHLSPRPSDFQPRVPADDGLVGGGERIDRLPIPTDPNVAQYRAFGRSLGKRNKTMDSKAYGIFEKEFRHCYSGRFGMAAQTLTRRTFDSASRARDDRVIWPSDVWQHPIGRSRRMLGALTPSPRRRTEYLGGARTSVRIKSTIDCK
jgi:hypothetical protein